MIVEWLTCHIFYMYTVEFLEINRLRSVCSISGCRNYLKVIIKSKSVNKIVLTILTEICQEERTSLTFWNNGVVNCHLK